MIVALRRRPFWFATSILTLILVAYTGAFAQAPTVNGYVEPGFAGRYSDDGPIESQNIMEEVQFMVESQWYGKSGESLDLRVLGRTDQNDETDIELREGSIFLPVSRSMELTVGRQVLSWGPAQFEFINDHFSKDFKSFFIGRDLEFLKAPNDAAKFSYFGDRANIDLVVSPSFDPDVLPSGRVIPVFNPGQQRLVDRDSAPVVRQPENSFDKWEVHARVHRTYERWELALYGYRGFTGSPRGWDGSSFYPKLSSAGFSIRGPYAGSVLWVEGSFDDIRHDEAGDTINLPPDRTHFLIGGRYRYTPTMKLMLQATWDHQINAEQYRRLLPSDHPDNQEDRFRLQGSVENTYMNERLDLGARGFVGVNEDDWHVRLTADYDWSDAVSLHGGTLLYGADSPSSRFGTMDDSDHIFTRIRYGF